MQTPLGQTDSESDTDSSSSYSTPPATSGESTNEEATKETRILHSERSFNCRRRGWDGGGVGDFEGQKLPLYVPCCPRHHSFL